MIYITGDTHGEFRRLLDFCDCTKTTKDDVMIILGDVGVNFSGDSTDVRKKQMLSQLPITLFCVHGNHEQRPENIKSYKTTSFHGGTVWYEYDYPNILFAKDGEIYDFNGLRCIAIGGAYSIDKWYRLRMGYPWFEDEQPSDETKKYVENQLAKSNWKIDVVLSHTVPFEYMPIDLFIPGIDQSSVDNSTEHWLSAIEIRLDYKWWYAGHYHTSRITEKIQIMFEDIEEFGIHKDQTEKELNELMRAMEKEIVVTNHCWINYHFENLEYSDTYFAGDFYPDDNNGKYRCSFRYDRINNTYEISNNEVPADEILPLPMGYLEWKLKEKGKLEKTVWKVSM